MSAIESRPHPNIALMFVRSIAILALPPEAQIDWLRSFGLGEPGIVDELALEFDQGWAAIESLRAEGWIPGRAIEPLMKIDAVFNSINDPSGPWSVDDLAAAPEWRQIRTLATECLYKLH